MFNFIEKLQNKPARERKNIVIALSCSITLVIFAVWLSVLLPQLSKTKQEAAVADTVVTSSDIVTPIDTFKRGISDGFANIASQFKALKDNITTAPALYQADKQN